MTAGDGFRDASFTGQDFNGATFRACDLRRVRIVDSWLIDVSLSGPGDPEETSTLGRCLGVIMREECEHRRYAVRDLAVLEARLSGQT